MATKDYYIGAVLTCTVRSVSRVAYCFLFFEISMSFPCASFTMLCTELSLAWSTLMRDSLSCLEYSLHSKRDDQQTLFTKACLL